MTTPPEDLASARREIHGRPGPFLFVTVMSLAQGGFFLLADSRFRALGIVLALAALVAAVAPDRSEGRWRSRGVHALAALQALLLGAHLGVAPLPYQYRFLLLALTLGWASAILGWLLSRPGPLTRDQAYLLVGSAAVGILLGELAVAGVDAWNRQNRLRGTGAIVEEDIRAHPGLGYYHARYGSGRSYFADNPRGYFDEASMPSRLWRIDRRSAQRGRLVFLDDGVVRVEELEGGLAWDSEGFEPPPGWHVRLLQSDLSDGLEPGRYELRFRGRAERPRSIEAGLVWEDGSGKALNRQRRVLLTADWQAHREELAIEEVRPEAHVEFRLGAERWPVELADVELRRLPDDTPLAVTPLPGFVVDYSFNDLGCRGPDYEIPKPADVRRILVLGDSVTLGMGVREADTFSRRLEQRLAERAGESGSTERWQVVNCGVSGYDTSQERRLYELIGRRYEPDIVLVALYRNDAISYLEAREKGYVERRAGRLELLFHTWGRLQRLRHQPPPPDFKGSVEELEALDLACRTDGARLVAIAFRSDRQPEWEALLRDVGSGLEGTDIPFLDIGPAVLEGHDDEELWVHRTDSHPNESVHDRAAGEIERFLDSRGLLIATVPKGASL